ncbi:MAG: HepT-like ribonuclease domain-containing protein [Trebonia sp.]
MRREELYLADLIDNARAVRGYLDGVTRERWDAEDILRDAVLYRMLLLGEIASALPDELRERYPDVAWRQVRAFRNLAVHKYFGVDWAVVWKVAQEEPSILESQVLAIIRAEYPALAQSYEPGPVPDPDTASLPTTVRGTLPEKGLASAASPRRHPAPCQMIPP